MELRHARRGKRASMCRETVTTQTGAVIRPELVAHAKALLAAGIVGADARRLAEELIAVALDGGEWLWPSDR
jgi:hypothetical protein